MITQRHRQLSAADIRPPSWLFRNVGLVLALLLMLGNLLSAQRPHFRTWNVGGAIGFSPINALSGLPTTRVDYRNWSLEFSPYAFNLGVGVTYHSPVFKLFKKVNWTVDGMPFWARKNANYFVTFPRVMSMSNFWSAGLMAGASVYFARRFSLELLAGAQYLAPYGAPELHYPANPQARLVEAGAIALHFRLFKQFQP